MHWLAKRERASIQATGFRKEKQKKKWSRNREDYSKKLINIFLRMKKISKFIIKSRINMEMKSWAVITSNRITATQFMINLNINTTASCRLTIKVKVFIMCLHTQPKIKSNKNNNQKLLTLPNLCKLAILILLSVPFPVFIRFPLQIHLFLRIPLFYRKRGRAKKLMK